MSKNAQAGWDIILSIGTGIPTFWWVCWMVAQLQHGFRWWMIPSIATQVVLAVFSIGAWNAAMKKLDQK